MNHQPSFSELVDSAAKLDHKVFEKFVAAVAVARTKQHPAAIDEEESTLLSKINRGFPVEKWDRLQFLDAKMESAALSDPEHEELTELTLAYERFCVIRIKLLKRLAQLRNISLEETLKQFGLQHGKV